MWCIFGVAGFIDQHWQFGRQFNRLYACFRFIFVRFLEDGETNLYLESIDDSDTSASENQVVIKQVVEDQGG